MKTAAVPPHDLDAERALLGALLVQPRDLPRASEGIAPADFFKEGHRLIFSAMLALLRRSEPVDVVTLTAELRQRGELDAVGGPAALAQILEDGALALNPTSYAAIVREAAVKRGILALAEDLSNKARNGLSGEKLLELTSAALSKLRPASAIGTVALKPTPAPASRHLVERLLLDGETTVVFGDGGSGKSLFALAVAFAVSTGIPLPCGFKPTRCVPVLLLDWESCVEEHQDRLHRLCAGLGVSVGAPIYYRPMLRALADEGPRLVAEARALGAGLVVVDSLVPASGAEPEGADAATRTMTAIRAFSPASRLVVSHVSKIAADQRGPSRPFGSVFVQNLARATWELRKADDSEGDLQIGLFNRKLNSGRLIPPLGLRVEFSESAIRFWPGNVAEQPDLAAKASVSWRILRALAGGALSQEEIVEAAQAGKDSVERTLRRLRARNKITRLPDGRWGVAAP